MGLRAHFGGSGGGRLLRRRGGLAVTFFLWRNRREFGEGNGRECRVERRVVSSNKRGNMVFMREGCVWASG